MSNKPAHITLTVTPSDERILDALDEYHGMLALVAEDLGCSLAHVEERVAANAEMQESVRKWREVMVDAGEAALYAAVTRGEAWAIKLVLTTLGKSRGYDLGSGRAIGTESAPIHIVLTPRLMQHSERITSDPNVIDN
jgi:hypothetical protein